VVKQVPLVVKRRSKILNLYAGVGGNRKLWTNCDVTAVEIDPKIAAVYKKLYPNDTVIVGDAHKYLIDHYYNSNSDDDFDFIWSSPPCQTHSRMVKATKHKLNKKYPDLSLYQEIIFLDNFFKGKWVVENVKPYYDPLIKATQVIGRHYFWSNIEGLDSVHDEPRPSSFINLTTLSGKYKLMDWLDIHYDDKLYYDGNHCPAQVLRNCVHPNLGLQVYEKSQLPL